MICLTHPISIGAILLIQTIIISLTIGFFNVNFWYSYILFLIIVGGILVLFAYITSVASNEKFTPSIKITIIIIVIIIIFIILVVGLDPFYSNLNDILLDTLPTSNKYNLSISKYFNYPNIIIIIILIVYLLITLIAVVKITSIKSGPLRQTN